MTDSTEKGNRLLNPASWLDRYGDYLFRYALSRLRNADSAEEVVQETLVAGLRHRDQYQGKGSEKAWLVAILKRKVIDHVRKRNRRGEIKDTDAETDLGETLFDHKGHWREDPRLFGPHPEAALENREFWEIFRDCLSKLPQRQADVFALREMDGRSSDEICKEMGLTSSNLWVLLYRARLGLSRCLKAHWQAVGGR
jgi:RNA polymerase sigma-70 factor (ECF subfamily)